MIFAEAGYLYLLLLIPVFIIVQMVVLKLRRRRLQKFGDEALVKSLMPSYSKAKVWLRLSLFLLAFFFFVLGISRPQMGAILKEHKTRGAEVMIVLDVSNSMLAEDYSPNRLERAKLAISRMVDKLREDRIGLIVFAGNSFVQLPITTDYVSAKMFLNSISTGSVPIQGTAIGDAIGTALRSFSAQSDKSRAIIVITDGENHEDDPVVGKGLYLRAGNSEFGLNPIIDEIARMDDEEYNSVVFEEYDELYMYFFGVALFFLVLEMLIGERRSKYHLFKR